LLLYVGGTVEIKIHNISGQLVNTLSQDTKQHGVYQIEVPLANISAGLFHCVLFVDGENIDSKNLIVNK